MIPRDLFGNPIGYLTGQAVLLDEQGKTVKQTAATPTTDEHPTDKKIRDQYDDLAATAELFGDGMVEFFGDETDNIQTLTDRNRQ